ncbi:MAG: methyltransferase domain-containing protein [Butyrivibrio sp.]|nr:methyltransferase domain-containing protein [Butyrivibrio sp.]
MDYLSVKETASKFGLSERRVQKLCETQRIEGANMVSGVWLIPNNAKKPIDERVTVSFESDEFVTLKELCDDLSISLATGKNWVKLGKIVPNGMERKTPVFSVQYVENLKNEIKSGENKALKSRRNKKYVSGNALYNSYVSDNCKSVYEVQKLLGSLETCDLELSKDVIQLFVADCALHLLADKMNLPFARNKGLLLGFVKGEISVGIYDELVNDLITNKESCIETCERYPLLFSLDYLYEYKEDVLGLIYISCKNIGNRKATGAYYTSNSVVQKLIGNLDISSGDSILDPCCGTGNFLLQLPEKVEFDGVYGYDIDSVSVKISRINMALRFKDADIQSLRQHFIEKNYLKDRNDIKFDYIIGNPPWGYEFSEQEKVELRFMFRTATGKNIESYDVFIEQALRNLKKDGTLSFVLPEAVLNVKAHMPIRNYIIEGNSINAIEYLGNAFDGVQCPCIIMNIAHTEERLSTIGLRIGDGNRNFVINTEREVTSEYFSFLTTDEEYEIIKKVNQIDNVAFLAGNADFALGIVTGDNKKYISTEKRDDNEMVLKGSDICKYHINPTDNYIVFASDSFQQVAPTELYRAEEKLLYRFICNQLVFAYDNQQTLSLNSCNIVVPHLNGISIKYILAVLNSRVAQYIYKKQFNSVKVLRSHIESIPIPVVDDDTQKKVIALTERLIEGCDAEEVTNRYDELDEVIFDIFKLDEEERKVVKEAVDGDNKFLL